MIGENDILNETDAIYNEFLEASDLFPTLTTFSKLCEYLSINEKNYKTVFSSLKAKLTSWKCQTLFNKLEKKSKHIDYKNKPCARSKVLIIGSGPIGLRTAVEAALLGAHVFVVESRNSFSRNNVLHLWPFLITDLKALGIKSFFGKFCAGTLDHISIRRLQCILLKICLVLGVQVCAETVFFDIVQPSDTRGWRCKFKPASSPLNGIEFDVVVGCDGKSNSLKFKRKEFRGKLAIAITCNFVNTYTKAEAAVEEISGVAYIYNQDFFHQLKENTGIELENIVYYKDETHYFVMTAKKKSLLDKGVIKQDYKDVFKLLSSENVSHQALLQYAKEAADFSTKYQLPHHTFAKNHSEKEDVAMFDFTSIHQAEYSSKIVERKGKRLLLCIAGDVLLEPFWPTGSGCARGFLGAMDVAWMVRGFSLGMDSVDLIQERESIFNILSQTKPDTLMKSHEKYSIDPFTRYSNLNNRLFKKEQIAYLVDKSDGKFSLETYTNEEEVVSKIIEVKQVGVDPDTLLAWCKEQTHGYSHICMNDMSVSWKNGLAFCAIVNRYRPDLLDYASLNFNNVEENCAKAFAIAEEYFGIPPKISGHDLVRQAVPDKLAIIAYVSLYYEALKGEPPAVYKQSNVKNEKVYKENISPKVPGKSKMSIISRLSKRNNTKNAKKKKDKDLLLNLPKDGVALTVYKANTATSIQMESKQVDLVDNKSSQSLSRKEIVSNGLPSDMYHEMTATKGEDKYKRISQLAQTVFGDTIVQSSTVAIGKSVTTEKDSTELSESEKCHFCHQKVYVMERQSCEGLFFHRKCFRCCVCRCHLLLGNYIFDYKEDDEGKFYCKLHYNKMIYQLEKKVNTSSKNERRSRPLTQVIESHESKNPWQNEIKSCSIIDIQAKLKENLPLITVKESNNKKDNKDSPVLKNDSSFNPNILSSRNLTSEVSSFSKALSSPKIQISPEITSSEKYGDICTPYDMFAARNLDVNHTSPPKKVITSSFFTAKKLSVSTPNLRKLIQEDEMFEEERKKHFLLQKSPSNKMDSKSSVTSGLNEKNCLNLSDNLLNPTSDEGIGRDRYQSFKIKENTTGAVQRRPLEERRAQYPVSTAFNDSIVNLQLISVDILIDEPEKNKDNQQQLKKKKKLVLKRKKIQKGDSSLVTSGKTISESAHAETFEKFSPKIEEKTILEKMNEPSGELEDDTDSDGCEEEKKDMEHHGLFSKIFVKKQKKKNLTPEEEEIAAKKHHSHQQLEIKKEMKEREAKRLWEAQSIQRKLDEVDVKQLELEERARKVERDLRNELPHKDVTKLTLEWCSLVNEKNLLLRFESELVIQSNSIQLEDRQARLEQQIRELLTCEKRHPDSQEQIKHLTKELVDTVEQRNALVEMLEEDRLREMEEDKNLQDAFSKKSNELGMNRFI